MLKSLDTALFAFHSALILFILCGWVWRRIRPAHLAVVALTAFSWFGLGMVYGWGYCPFTEWHWRVRLQLGHTDMPRSYIKFLFDQCTGLDAPAVWVDTVTVTAFFIAAALSIALTLRDRRKDERKAQTASG